MLKNTSRILEHLIDLSKQHKHTTCISSCNIIWLNSVIQLQHFHSYKDGTWMLTKIKNYQNPGRGETGKLTVLTVFGAPYLIYCYEVIWGGGNDLSLGFMYSHVFLQDADHLNKTAARVSLTRNNTLAKVTMSLQRPSLTYSPYQQDPPNAPRSHPQHLLVQSSMRSPPLQDSASF